MSLTRRTHYNPCFWTACWNPDYYALVVRKAAPVEKCRDVPLHVLNLRANKILACKSENVFREEGLGLSTITREQALEYCKRVSPDKYSGIVEWYKENPGDLTLDFENFFTAIEQSGAYKSLMDTIANQGIRTREDKANLATFIVFHQMRNYGIIDFMSEVGNGIGEHRFEQFIRLKHLWSNSRFLYSQVSPIVRNQWVLYKTSDFSFPINDAPITPPLSALPTARISFLDRPAEKAVDEKGRSSSTSP